MNTIIIGSILSLIVSGFFAIRNRYEKNVQIMLTMAGYAVALVEYIFIYYSPAYITLISFTIVYIISYQFRSFFLHRFKVDFTFVLMLILLLITIVVSIFLYDGPGSIAGIIILFLEMFAVFVCSAQGLRYKNLIVSVLYVIMDIGAGNYIALLLDVINIFVPIFEIWKHKGDSWLDNNMLNENIELVKVSSEVRKFRKTQQKK